MIGNRIMIVSAALWAAAGIATGTLRSIEETPPPPAAESPEPVLAEILAKADRLPLPPQDPKALLAKAFADQVPSPPIATVTPETSAELVGTAAQIKPKKLTSHLSDNICTRHGMRKVVTHSGRSWRCR